MSASSCGMSALAAARIATALGRHRNRRLHLVAPGALGGVLRRVRVCDQVLAPDAERVAGRDPDAAGEIDGCAEPLDADLGDTPADALGDRARCGCVRAVEDDHELLAAVAADDI